MINTKELRQALGALQPEEVAELLDRLEAAESECLEQARLNGMGSEREAALMAKLEAAEKERDECNRRRLEAADHFAAQTELMKKKYDELRVKVAEMERQEPVGKFVQHPSNGLWEQDGYGDNPDANPLYALPGAQAQPAPSMPEVTDAMALAFHHALTDGSIGAREVEEIKDALRAALAAAPKLEGE